MKYIINLLFSISFFSVFSQNIDSLEINTDTLSAGLLHFNDISCTSFAIETNQMFGNKDICLFFDADSCFLTKDEDAIDGKYRTSLHVLANSNSFKSLKFARKMGLIKLFLVSVPKVCLTGLKGLKSGGAAPAMIDQSVWRAGLISPSYTRVYSDVKNIIIHHSAGSNFASDFVDVVRNIYIYHTQGNKWSDIGYNYLIAPDGTIFKGRDPGESFLQDEVAGAHFCASNAGTMGVCLLGDYQSITPPDAALRSLVELLAWKCTKNKLDPLARHAHPLNDTLGVIDGHRLGCSTECPGQYLFAALPRVRLNVSRSMSGLPYLSNDDLSVSYFQTLLCQTSTDLYLNPKIATNATVFTTLGEVYKRLDLLDGCNTISLLDWTNGLYVIKIGEEWRKIIVNN